MLSLNFIYGESMSNELHDCAEKERNSYVARREITFVMRKIFSSEHEKR
jgi:hypothetical protein